MKGSLVMHRQIQHGVAKGSSGQVGDKEGEGGDPRTYRITFPVKAGTSPLRVKGCSGQVATRIAMWVRFWHQHVRDTVVILEEVNFPHPWCPMCDTLVPWISNKGMHRCTAQCKKGEERKQQRLAAE